MREACPVEELIPFHFSRLHATGTVPEELARLTALKWLRLDSNQLTGKPFGYNISSKAV